MQFYKTIADYYDYIFPLKQPQLNFLNKLCSIYDIKTMLDIGCATGAMAAFMSDFIDEVSAFDLDESMINIAGKTHSGIKVKYQVGDMLCLDDLYEDSFKESARKNYQDLKALGWYIEDYHLLQGAREEFFNAKARQHLKKSGIPVENSKGEFGLGQHELNICYTSPLEVADRHVIYKQCLKELADQMDIAVTFMAKCDEEQAGSSCHMHISLWKDGTNAFLGEQALGALQCSDTFRWFLGGWMQYTPELMPFYAPTINSYKRFQDASWAPTRLAWSVDNRSSGFRILNHGDNLRIECRIPGADCNPYLAFAAALASGLEGIKRKIEPPPVYQGDVYANKDLPELPKSLYAANHLFKNSQFARDAFGKEAHEHYVHHFSKEQQAYDKAVTNWELKRYFERI